MSLSAKMEGNILNALITREKTSRNLSVNFPGHSILLTKVAPKDVVSIAQTSTTRKN